MFTELGKEFEARLLYEDRDILVFDKPSGMQIQGANNSFPDGGVQDLVRASRGIHWLAIDHLDQDTSGIMLFGKDEEIKAELQRQFMQREMNRYYLTVVTGGFDPQISGIVAPLKYHPDEAIMKVLLSNKAMHAATRFEFIDTATDEQGLLVSMLWVKPYTDRTHQIRAHLSFLGYPIVGDSCYNPNPRGAKRLLLHATSIYFTHPVSGSSMQIDVPIPDDFDLNHSTSIA